MFLLLCWHNRAVRDCSMLYINVRLHIQLFLTLRTEIDIYVNRLTAVFTVFIIYLLVYTDTDGNGINCAVAN
jgi:heme/copper-type cytochrome/quinol oxidase subunit 4